MSQHAAIIWNPTKTERDALDKALAKAKPPADVTITWWETTPDDPGQGVAEQALAAGADLLVVAGGDGTVRAVSEHLAESRADVQMAIVPLGTGNLLARNLGIPINNMRAALARAFTGEERPVDVGWVDVDVDGAEERHAFVVMIGFGVDANMIEETDDDLKDRAGWLAYVESLGRALQASEVVPFHVTKDDEPARDETGHTLLIANCGTIQGGLTLLPDADPSDGQLDYLVLSAEGFAQWAGTVKTLVWDNGVKRLLSWGDSTADSEAVDKGRATKLTVTLPDARAFQIDGESIGQTRSFRVSIQPAALRVL